MIQFILNNREVHTGLPKGTLLLDYIRYHQHMHGTKIGCREGDCGACTVLVGDLKEGKMYYRSFTSCLTPIGNVHGKHIVTVEGLNLPEGLNFVQQAFTEEGASQCGFCTPGFIVSLGGLTLQQEVPDLQKGIDTVNGNICRCTGYKSIERAIAKIVAKLQERKQESAIDFAVNNQLLPQYFVDIPEKLAALQATLLKSEGAGNTKAKYVGGGTDLYVQQHDTMIEEEINFLLDKTHLTGIAQTDNLCMMGASVTAADIAVSQVFNNHINNWQLTIKLVSSTQIRNMATIAGNFVNASPIGDFSIFFLALDAHLILSDGENNRELPLRKLYKGYKTLDKTAEEHIEKIFFHLPDEHTYTNFEKVCKRTHLDIASVNCAIRIKVVDGVVHECGIAAGGVGPVPLYLPKTSEYLLNKTLTIALVDEVCKLAQTEVSPISDVRGTSTYKRLLLEQLIKAHFIKLFPQMWQS